jgi:hypothetical protein
MSDKNQSVDQLEKVQDHAELNKESFASNVRDSKDDIQMKPQYNGVVEPQISALIIDHDKKDAEVGSDKAKEGLPSLAGDQDYKKVAQVALGKKRHSR